MRITLSEVDISKRKWKDWYDQKPWYGLPLLFDDFLNCRTATRTYSHFAGWEKADKRQAFVYLATINLWV